MKTRKQLQDTMVSTAQDFDLVILEWATGTGKSFGAISLTQVWKPKTILLLVAEDAHKENWTTECKKWASLGKQSWGLAFTCECYASLKKYENTEWDLVILDEAHHIFSDLRMSLLNTIKTKKMILLSATLEYGHLSQLFVDRKITKENHYHSKVTLSQAIEWGILPEPNIYLIPLKIDNKVKDQLIIEEWGEEGKRVLVKTNLNDQWLYKKNKTKFPNITLHIECTALEKLQYIDSNIQYFRNLYMRNRQEFIKNKWLRLGSERKRFLGELKTMDVQILLDKLDKKRYICFCTSIEQANEFNSEKSINSKNTKTQNNKTITSFQEKEINHLFCVDMLTEGQNLVDIEAGIIVQLDGKERPFIQKSGRVMRSETPQQFIFYYKDTRDEEYLNKILEGINPEYIQVIENIKQFKI